MIIDYAQSNRPQGDRGVLEFLPARPINAARRRRVGQSRAPPHAADTSTGRKAGGRQVRRMLSRRVRPVPGRATREDIMAVRFLQDHARLGVLLSLATLGELAGYAWLGQPQADRGTLLVLSFASAVGTVSLWWIGPVMARHRHYAAFFVVWSAAIVALILLGSALDGGEKSPIAVLLFLPLLYSALAYRPLIVLVMGAAELVGYVMVTYTDGIPNTAYATLMAGTLTLTMLMAAQSARNREEQARELHALAVRLEAEATPRRPHRLSEPAWVRRRHRSRGLSRHSLRAPSLVAAPGRRPFEGAQRHSRSRRR